jgi:hypothetical protein
MCGKEAGKRRKPQHSQGFPALERAMAGAEVTKRPQEFSRYVNQTKSRGIYPRKTQSLQGFKKGGVVQPGFPERGLKPVIPIRQVHIDIKLIYLDNIIFHLCFYPHFTHYFEQ